jgi:hypothetical protein
LIKTLLANSLPKGVESDDADTRKAAVESLSQILDTFGIRSFGTHLSKEIYQTLVKCLDDYQVDRRGDVGSFVRNVAMVSLKEFIH